MPIFAPGDEKHERYPYMSQYTDFVKRMERPLVGREKEIRQLLEAMLRPELCNVILLADAGSGKTALVQGTMAVDTKRAYLEISLSKMIGNATNNENEMADMLKQLFDEVQRFSRETGKEIVLFIDEFHQIVQLSSAAVEVMKPLLADSGTRGIKVIAATTYIEFQDHIAQNLPLVERLQRINLSEPDKKTVVAILRGMADRYGVTNQFPTNAMFEMIYEYTNQYIPANAQPRKSILMLDSMIGKYRYAEAIGHPCPIDRKMLADVIYETEGFNIAFRVDAPAIAEKLNKAVVAQEFAVAAIESRLQICCADLNNKNKPMASFLFTGSTGVGKGLVNDTPIPVYTEDGSVLMKRNGDLKVGDYVYNRKGEPVEVVGVYPRGMQDIYEVTLTDGRQLLTDNSHLWTYRCSGKNETYTNSTQELFDRGVYIITKSGKRKAKYQIPTNDAVQYPDAKLAVHPYVMGAFLGDGCMTVKQLTLSSSDEDIVKRCATLLGGCTYKSANAHRSYSWIFPLDDQSGRAKTKQMRDVFGDYPEVCGKLASEKAIPAAYMTASIEQRWELVRGLFDTDGSIGAGSRYNLSYSTSSKQLAFDIQQLLYSLGVTSTVTVARSAETKVGHYEQYRVSVKVSHDEKEQFFWLKRKADIARAAKAEHDDTKSGKDRSWVGIADIRKLDEQRETTCIYVNDNEHLYLAGQYVVTHNTEMTKQLAKILFGSEDKLIRMDMTEYALDDSLNRFREELTSKVWAHPYSIVLLDEIEKACAPVTRLLLQVLDDGRLIDRHNREVTFKNCYIVVTTNAGSEVYKTIAQYNSDDTGSGAVLEKYDKLIKDSIINTTGNSKFPPELLGRIDRIVPFQPLSEATMAEICKRKLLELRARIHKQYGYDLQLDNVLIKYIVQEKLTTDSDAGGARGVITRIEREIVTPVATFINAIDKTRVKDGNIYVQVIGEMSVDNKALLQSGAYVKVDYQRDLDEMERRERAKRIRENQTVQTVKHV